MLTILIYVYKYNCQKNEIAFVEMINHTKHGQRGERERGKRGGIGDRG